MRWWWTVFLIYGMIIQWIQSWRREVVVSHLRETNFLLVWVHLIFSAGSSTTWASYMNHLVQFVPCPPCYLARVCTFSIISVKVNLFGCFENSSSVLLEVVYGDHPATWSPQLGYRVDVASLPITPQKYRYLYVGEWIQHPGSISRRSPTATSTYSRGVSCYR